MRSLAGGFTGVEARRAAVGACRSRCAPIRRRATRATCCCPRSASPASMKLLAAKVVCIGAGGLGSPSSMYLAAAGVGTLGMIDDDVVDASNLQRQILHGTDRARHAEGRERRAHAQEPQPRREGRQAPRAAHVGATRSSCSRRYDVIIDGADNFATRYLVNDVALRLGKPVVHASIFRFEGQLTVFPAQRLALLPLPVSASRRRPRRRRRAPRAACSACCPASWASSRRPRRSS